MLTKNPYLMEIKINENQTKETLPKQVIFEASDFTKIKTGERPQIGQISNPLAELTKLVSFIMNPGKMSNHSNVLLRIAIINAYEELRTVIFRHTVSKEVSRTGQSKHKNNKAGRLGRLKHLVTNLHQEPE